MATKIYDNQEVEMVFIPEEKEVLYVFHHK